MFSKPPSRSPGSARRRNRPSRSSPIGCKKATWRIARGTLFLLGKLGPVAKPAVPAILRAMTASDAGTEQA